MTGALVKVGQRFGAALLGGDPYCSSIFMPVPVPIIILTDRPVTG